MKLTKSQYNATKASYEHWRDDIVKPLSEGRELRCDYFLGVIWADTEEEAPIHGRNCALCKIYRNFLECSNHCTLVITNNTCPSADSSYIEFYNDPNLDTATAMMNALKNILDNAEC